MSRAIASRLAKLEGSTSGGEDGPGWWAIQRWLGHPLTPEQDAAADAWHARQPKLDPSTPLDTRGWSREAREALGFHGPAQEFHVADAGRLVPGHGR